MIHPFRLPVTLAALLVLIDDFHSPSLDAPAGTGELPPFGLALEQFAHLSAAGSCGAPHSQWGGLG